MIIGSIKNIEKEGGQFHPLLYKCLRYLQDTDFSEMGPGTYKLKGDSVFVIVQNYWTESPEKKKPETHERYIDIQYVALGKENMGFAPVSDQAKMEENFLNEKDVGFYSDVENESMLTLSAGMYAILYPWDIHRPACVVENPAFVKKVIVKIETTELDIV